MHFIGRGARCTAFLLLIYILGSINCNSIKGFDSPRPKTGGFLALFSRVSVFIGHNVRRITAASLTRLLDFCDRTGLYSLRANIFNVLSFAVIPTHLCRIAMFTL
ncbi:hypothetical protein C8J57DRAFT_1278147 [Mycena rebaudengoi]|nr:hypothetical protein C8J57DRAFT_1278147 [Mycena rebaudengoi]